ncbi:MAG TPA: DUF6680 family protein [Arachidicoccus soli]|uniref:DUF6680 domain-containing protein n=1 Tax=Arachidicoccus soli TaxID=2341117 RepID=A0A386HSW2_9BACT|nr:DUF6680 family protein [Arachidicoccus soli]AYD49027.1 hypothetical protein D6B99_16240 [Arachidicoccus soli]HEU0227105.1 DUF6680 family protein [Arachidicoccus soli]
MKRTITFLIFITAATLVFGQAESPNVPSKPILSLNEILTLLAIILGPIVAVQLQKYLDRNREIQNRKLNIFKMLMASRGATLSASHVEALNRIDLEFSGDKKYKNVIDAWKEYFDNLCIKVETNDSLTIWSVRNEELLANLLFEMGKSLGYNFDKVLIKRNVYSPVGHERIERESQLIRKKLLDVLNQETAISMTIISDEQALAKQTELQTAMLKYYNSKNDEG